MSENAAHAYADGHLHNNPGPLLFVLSSQSTGTQPMLDLLHMCYT